MIEDYSLRKVPLTLVFLIIRKYISYSNLLKLSQKKIENKENY